MRKIFHIIFLLSLKVDFIFECSRRKWLPPLLIFSFYSFNFRDRMSLLVKVSSLWGWRVLPGTHRSKFLLNERVHLKMTFIYPSRVWQSINHEWYILDKASIETIYAVHFINHYSWWSFNLIRLSIFIFSGLNISTDRDVRNNTIISCYLCDEFFNTNSGGFKRNDDRDRDVADSFFWRIECSW